MLSVVDKALLKPIVGCAKAFILFDPNPGWFRRSVVFTISRDRLLHWLTSEADAYFVCFDPYITEADSPHITWDQVAPMTWRIPSRQAHSQFIRFLQGNAEWVIYKSSRDNTAEHAQKLHALSERDGALLCEFLTCEGIQALATPLEDGGRILLFEQDREKGRL